MTGPDRLAQVSSTATIELFFCSDQRDIFSERILETSGLGDRSERRPMAQGFRIPIPMTPGSSPVCGRTVWTIAIAPPRIYMDMLMLMLMDIDMLMDMLMDIDMLVDIDISSRCSCSSSCSGTALMPRYRCLILFRANKSMSSPSMVVVFAEVARRRCPLTERARTKKRRVKSFIIVGGFGGVSFGRLCRRCEWYGVSSRRFSRETGRQTRGE